ncbi:MAG: type II secretion system F family protein [Acidimicrobiales bacterium]
MSPEIVIGVLIAAVGVIVVRAGVVESRRLAVEDPADFLTSLDTGDERTDEFRRLLAEPFLGRVLRPVAGRLVGVLSTALPGNYRDGVRRRLMLAGLAGRYRAEEVITGQVLAAIAGVIVVLLWALVAGGSSRLTILFVVAAPAIGAMIPPALLNRAVAARQDAIRRDLPDTMDLLAISVEAGVGFEGAVDVVCHHFDSPLAEEFSRTLKEMELGLPRREALQNLKRRTEVSELSNFVLALTQADALGMPIGRVLKTQAGEMRAKRRQWARERAAKLPIKILFPLVGLIFPPMFVIILGPAASEIAKVFAG